MVDLLEVKDGVLRVRGLDALDGTPVIDIKMYSADIDCAGKDPVLPPAGSSRKIPQM